MTQQQTATVTARLIRHGQSTSNLGGQTTDPATIPLSNTGKLQAQAFADSFVRSPGLIVTSPFLRARHTAAPTIERFPSVPVAQWPVEEFTYLRHLHGTRTTGLERRSIVDAYWNTADPQYVDDEKSESFEGVCDRAQRLLTRLSRRDGTVVVFTHSQFMRVVLWVILAEDTAATAGGMRRFARFKKVYLIPNCSIITLSLHPELGWAALGAEVGHLPDALHTGG